MAYPKTVLKTWVEVLKLDVEEVKESDIREAIPIKLKKLGVPDSDYKDFSLGKQVEVLLAKMDLNEAEKQNLGSEDFGETENQEVTGSEDQVKDSLERANMVAPPVDANLLTEESTPDQEKGTTDKAFSELNVSKVPEEVIKKVEVEDPTVIKSATMTLKKEVPGSKIAHYDKEVETLVIVLRSVGSVRIGKYSVYLQKSNKPTGVPTEIVGQLIAKGAVTLYGRR